MTDQMIDNAFDVTSQLFGAESGVPWWAWVFVVLAFFWKLVVPERKTAAELAAERDAQLLGEVLGEDDGDKKGKKGKKAKKK